MKSDPHYAYEVAKEITPARQRCDVCKYFLGAQSDVFLFVCILGGHLTIQHYLIERKLAGYIL